MLFQRMLVQITQSPDLPSPGSPFIVEAKDNLMVVARGRCLKAAAIDREATFEIDSRLATLQAKPRIKITGRPNHPVIFSPIS